MKKILYYYSLVIIATVCPKLSASTHTQLLSSSHFSSVHSSNYHSCIGNRYTCMHTHAHTHTQHVYKLREIFVKRNPAWNRFAFYYLFVCYNYIKLRTEKKYMCIYVYVISRVLYLIIIIIIIIIIVIINKTETAPLLKLTFIIMPIHFIIKNILYAAKFWIGLLLVVSLAFSNHFWLSLCPLFLFAFFFFFSPLLFLSDLAGIFCYCFLGERERDHCLQAYLTWIYHCYIWIYILNSGEFNYVQCKYSMLKIIFIYIEIHVINVWCHYSGFRCILFYFVRGRVCIRFHNFIRRTLLVHLNGWMYTSMSKLNIHIYLIDPMPWNNFFIA